MMTFNNSFIHKDIKCVHKAIRWARVIPERNWLI